MTRRNLSAAAVAFGLAAAIHTDWHFARPSHHQLSLGLPWHWVFAIPVFALVAWYVARAWPDRILFASLLIVGGAIIGAGILEPAYEYVVDRAPMEWVFGRERNTALAAFCGMGLLAYLLVLAAFRSAGARTMGRWQRSALLLLVASVGAGCGPAASTTATPATSRWVFPGASWDSVPDIRSAGWSRAGLDSVRARLQALPSTGFVAIAGGRVLMSYGNPTEISYLASVRKSVLSMLMGNYVRRGTVRLEASLAELGMDDVGGLTAAEKEATVLDLLTARSGVYHPASNDGDDLASAPPRGSQQHGTYYLYSNWDFNALGSAFERMTGRDIYDVLASDLAGPIGMEDFDRTRHRKTGDSTKSRHLAYHMHFSTRDMARIGYLMLRRGQWRGRQVIPADWVDESTRAFTKVSEMNPARRRSGAFGYGYLWWVFDGPRASGPYKGAYAGLGAIGQHILVLPELDLVVAHKTRPGQRDAEGRARTVPHDVFFEVIDVLVRAHCGTACPPEGGPPAAMPGAIEDDEAEVQSGDHP
jgi:CubicO group peptidase (beta-lactamase class C family)